MLGDSFVTNISRQQCSPWVDGYRLGSVVGLVDAHKPVCQLKHVVAQTNNHKLRILGSLLDIVCNDRHILEICRHKQVSPEDISAALACHAKACLHYCPGCVVLCRHGHISSKLAVKWPCAHS